MGRPRLRSVYPRDHPGLGFHLLGRPEPNKRRPLDPDNEAGEESSDDPDIAAEHEGSHNPRTCHAAARSNSRFQEHPTKMRPRALTSPEGRRGSCGVLLSCPYRKRNPHRFHVRHYRSCTLQGFSNFALLKYVRAPGFVRLTKSNGRV